MPKIAPEQLEARRRAILEGARRCFARHGYEGATVRLLEQETALSRGAIFHHFHDKESLFFAVAEDDALEMATVVAEHGLVQVMRELRERDAGWLGSQLEVTRRLRTDAAFRRRWAARSERIARAARERLERQREAGQVRDDVPVETLVSFLTLVLDGLVTHRAMGMTVADLDAVLDLVESAVRKH
jgi:AcrR family transcriptional regulator